MRDPIRDWESMNDLPTHVVAKPGHSRSLCGVKDPIRVVAAKFVEAHVEGHGMVVCEECEKVSDA